MANKISPREAALAVLAKASELYKESVLSKADPYRSSASRAKQESKHMRDQKGVHKPISSDFKTGESYAGAANNAGKYLKENPLSASSMASAEKRAKEYKESAKDDHKKVLGEMKGMKKHALGPEQIREKMASSAGKSHDPKEIGKSEKSLKKHALSPEQIREKMASPAGKEAGVSEHPAEMKKSDEMGNNPDAKADADLGEQVEQDVKQHEENNEDPAHSSPMKGHIKLAKFMGRMEHKRSLKKADPTPAASPSPQGIGTGASGYDGSNPVAQGVANVFKAESSFDKLKNKIKSKEGYSEKGAAGAAYEAGKKKYGKAGMAAKAAAGRKK